MAEKKNTVRMTSPKGVAKYPKLGEPDTRFKEDGEFNVKLLLDADDAATKEFMKALREVTDAGAEEARKDLKPVKAKTLEVVYPYKDEADRETGEPTGNIEFNFKTSATYKTKDGEMKQRKVPLFDSKGKAIERKVNVGGGSIIKVNFTPGPYYMANGNKAGVSLYINAVQILQLKEWKGASAEDYGFGQEEGYEDEGAQFEDSGPVDSGQGDF